MVSLLLAFRGLRQAVAAVLRDPETKALPVVAGVLVLTGTTFYWQTEDWTFIQALYFSVVTLTTVGYGDFTPTSAGTQIFTIIYISPDSASSWRCSVRWRSSTSSRSPRAAAREHA